MQPKKAHIAKKAILYYFLFIRNDKVLLESIGSKLKCKTSLVHRGYTDVRVQTLTFLDLSPKSALFLPLV